MIPLILAALTASAAALQAEKPPVRCIENSPERRGQEGCTILANRHLRTSVGEPLYWHLDRFDSVEAAQDGATDDSVVAEAHGSVWRMTVERKSGEHLDGHHVAWIGPLPLLPGRAYAMRVQSSLLGPGSVTPVHTHPGPEVIYVVAGEQCLETSQAGERIGPGKSGVVPAGVSHAGSVVGSEPRRAIAVVLYDAAHPASHNLDDPPRLLPCK